MHGSEREPLLVADRGASAAAPEHTIAAFERAVAEGADGLWLDVHCSRDHHPVIIHDFTLERTTDGAGPVGDHDLRALKRLDAGGWHGAPFVGQRLQTLEEVLERFRDRRASCSPCAAGSRATRRSPSAWSGWSRSTGSSTGVS